MPWSQMCKEVHVTVTNTMMQHILYTPIVQQNDDRGGRGQKKRQGVPKCRGISKKGEKMNLDELKQMLNC